MDKQEISGRFKTLQDDICNNLESLDGLSTFKVDEWQRDGGGGGDTRTMENGSIIEKGGVNFSEVYGIAPQGMMKTLEMSLDLENPAFFATGISIVLHPNNPYVPIIHMNLRYFELYDGGEEKIVNSWFGGGIDLSPHYIDKEDAAYFHSSLKDVCDKHNAKYYAEFKKWADDYFYIKHRQETRGVGGIFFDRLGEFEDITMEERFAFVRDVGQAFVPIYAHLANKNKDQAYGEKETAWQLLRRGRYVEFNLVYDRGTAFGLQTNGRAESILMSLPAQASWKYDHYPLPNSDESKTLELLKKGIDWIYS